MAPTIMHVLHILLAGKWDPFNLLDDNDLWISSESFISAMGHAVSAAEAAADILDFDPDLEFHAILLWNLPFARKFLIALDCGQITR